MITQAHTARAADWHHLGLTGWTQHRLASSHGTMIDSWCHHLAIAHPSTHATVPERVIVVKR